MFQLHQYNFAETIANWTYAYWTLHAFDGEVPTSFQAMPFEIGEDKLAPYNNCRMQKYMRLTRVGDTLRFENDTAQHNPAYKGTQRRDGWVYTPDNIIDSHGFTHAEERYRGRYHAGTLRAWTPAINFIKIFDYPHGDEYLIYQYDEPVTIDKFLLRQGHGDARYQCRGFRVEYKDTDDSWVTCYDDTVYPYNTGAIFQFPGGAVTSKEFRMTIVSGYSNYDCYFSHIGLIGPEKPVAEDFTPTWGILVPGEWQGNYAEGLYRDEKHWPAILVKLNAPGVVGEGVRINRASYAVGEQLGVASIYLKNDIWQSMGPDTEKPVFVAPTTIQLAATDASGTLKTAPQIQAFFDSIRVTDNYDAYIEPTNDCPDLLPMGETVVTFTAVDRAGNEETHACTITIADMTPPAITITGDITYTLEAGTPYVEEGATALDNVDGDVTGSIVTTGSELVDHNTLGIYTVDYTCEDAAGNSKTETRTITVEDSESPVVTAPNGTTFNAVDTNGRPATEADIVAWLASATALDIHDGATSVSHDCPAVLPIGDTLVTFTSTDAAGNTGVAGATITIADNTPPVITLVGNSAMNVEFGDVFTDPGFSAYDNVDGDITGNVVTGGIVDTSVLGDVVLTYDVSDAAGNPAGQVQRTVTVVDTTAPDILLTGDATINLNQGDAYSEQGATASDLVDGDVTGSIVINSNVNTAVKGTYQVTYNVSDAAGNAATEVVRTVIVHDVTVPVITLIGDATINLNVNDPYTEQGATATDNSDGDISGSIVINSNVNTSVADTYQVTYNVADASGNDAIEVVRTVVVTEV